MALITENDLFAAYPPLPPLLYHKASFNGTANGYTSLWKAASSLTPAGANPGTTAGAVCTSATTGAMKYVNPPGGKRNYLAAIVTMPQSFTTWFFCDRLVHSDGLSSNSTSVQAVGTPALTRYTDGAGVELWLEVYTALGATGSTYTVTYTNEKGATGRVGTAVVPASPVAGRMIQVALQAGDKGVRSVQSVQCGALSGTAGSFGVTLLRPLFTTAGNSTFVALLTGMDKLGGLPVNDNACISAYTLPQATAVGTMHAYLSFVQAA